MIEGIKNEKSSRAIVIKVLFIAIKGVAREG